MRALLSKLSPFKVRAASKRPRSDEPSGNKPKGVRQALLLGRRAVSMLDFDVDLDLEAMAVEADEAASALAGGADEAGGECMFFDTEEYYEYYDTEEREAGACDNGVGGLCAETDDKEFFAAEEEGEAGGAGCNNGVGRLMKMAWNYVNMQRWSAEEREALALSPDSVAAVQFFECHCNIKRTHGRVNCVHRTGALPAHILAGRTDTMDHAEADRVFFFAAMLRYSMDADSKIHYYVLGVEVCQALFCEYYATLRQTMTDAIKLAKSGQDLTKGRPKRMSSLLGQVPTARSESVQPFLLSLAGKIADDGFGLSMVGDAQEHPNVYLPLSFKIIVWNLYYVAVSNALCYTQFLRVWARECPWIKLARKIGTHKVCRICGMLRLELLKRNTQARKLELRDIGSKHLAVIKRARGAHADRDLLALPVRGKPSSEALSASVDKAGKQCSILPWLKETMKGLWDNRLEFGLMCVYFAHVGIYCFYVLPFVGGGANMCIECIAVALFQLQLSEYKGHDWPNVFYLQLDNTTSDNKNLAMLGFSGLLLLMGVFQVVQINFLILGHTHAAIDMLFSIFGRMLRVGILGAGALCFPTLTAIMVSTAVLGFVPHVQLLVRARDWTALLVPCLNKLQGIARSEASGDALHGMMLRRDNPERFVELFYRRNEDQPWEPRPGALGQDAREAGFDVQGIIVGHKYISLREWDVSVRPPDGPDDGSADVTVRRTCLGERLFKTDPVITDVQWAPMAPNWYTKGGTYTKVKSTISKFRELRLLPDASWQWWVKAFEWWKPSENEDGEPGPPKLTRVAQGDPLRFPAAGKFEVHKPEVVVVQQMAPVRLVTDQFTAADRMREMRFVRNENIAVKADLPVASFTLVAVLTKVAAAGSDEYKINDAAGMLGAPVTFAYVGDISKEVDTTDPKSLIPLQYLRKKSVKGPLRTLYDVSWCSWVQDSTGRDVAWVDEVSRASLIMVDMKVNKLKTQKKHTYTYVEFKSLASATLKTLATVPEAKVGEHTKRPFKAGRGRKKN